MKLLDFIFLLIRLITGLPVKFFRRRCFYKQDSFIWRNNQTQVELIRFNQLSFDKLALQCELATNHAENHHQDAIETLTECTKPVLKEDFLFLFFKYWYQFLIFEQRFFTNEKICIRRKKFI